MRGRVFAQNSGTPKLHGAQTPHSLVFTDN